MSLNSFWAPEWECLFQKIPFEQRDLFLTRGVGDRLRRENCVTVHLLGTDNAVFEGSTFPEDTIWESGIKGGATRWLHSLPSKFNAWHDSIGNGDATWNTYDIHYLCIALDGDLSPESEEVKETLKGFQEAIWERGGHWYLGFYKLDANGYWEEIHFQALKGRLEM